MTLDPSQVIAAIHAKLGVLPLAAESLGCKVFDILDAAQIYPEIQAAMDQERAKTDGAAQLKFRQAVLDGEAWAVRAANDAAENRAADVPAPHYKDEPAQHLQFIYDARRKQAPRSAVYIAFREQFPTIKKMPNQRAGKLFTAHWSAAKQLLGEDGTDDIDTRRLLSDARVVDLMNDKTAYNRDPNRHNGNVLAALKHQAQLWGLYMPVKTEISGTMDHKISPFAEAAAKAYGNAPEQTGDNAGGSELSGSGDSGGIADG